MLCLRVLLQHEWPRSGNGRLGTGLLEKLSKGVCSAVKDSFFLCPPSDLDVMFLAPTASCEVGSHMPRMAEEKARWKLDIDAFVVPSCPPLTTFLQPSSSLRNKQNCLAYTIVIRGSHFPRV